MVTEQVIKYIREKGFKDAVIADVIGLSKASMSNIMNGKRAFTADEYVKVCDFFEVPYDRFILK